MIRRESHPSGQRVTSGDGTWVYLVQVLGLDLVARLTHLAGPVSVGEHQLVDDDVVRVDLALGELLDQPLGLVQRQELCDAHADEGGLLLEEEGGGHGA